MAIERKQLKKNDPFALQVRGLLNKVAEERRAFLLGLVLVLGVGLGLTFWMTQKQAKAVKGRDALFLAKKTLETESKAASGKKITLELDLKNGLKQLQEVSSRFSGTRAGLDANLILGNLCLKNNQPENAVSWYQKSLAQATEPFEKALILSSLGYTFESLKKFQDALSYFEKSLNLGEEGIKGDLLLAIARCYEELKDVPKARSTYDRILSQLPNTEVSKKAETLKSQI